jgi:hypothetical protein
VSQEPISPESPRLLATMAGPDWRDVKANDDSGTIRQKILSYVLLSPNLIVLCGLGTSMYLKDQGGKRLAPTMSDLWSEVSKGL